MAISSRNFGKRTQRPGPQEQLRLIDNRAARRRKILKGARIRYAGCRFSVACTVRDMTELGARLVLTYEQALPHEFTLFIDMDGTEINCTVIWYTDREVGVAFTSDWRKVEAVQRQITGLPKPAPKPLMIRREPRPRLKLTG